MFCLELSSDLPIEQWPLQTVEKRDYTLEMDNHISVITDICDIFEDSGSIHFSMSGFSREVWPVDCRFDLSTVVDQIIEQLHQFALEKNNGSIDFFEQGTNISLVFDEKDDGLIEIQCLDFLDRTPDPIVEKLEKQELYEILKKIKDQFLLYAKKLCPDLLGEPLLAEWLVQHPE